jgi:DNA polymerase III epsilon subunit family exonuclease
MTDPVDRYQNLCERALEFVRSRNGMCHEEELIAFVFGASKAPKLWVNLLADLLKGEPQLQRVAGDRWVAFDGNRSSSGPLLPDFVALDVETTGLRAIDNRIIEIGLARYRDGVAVDRLSTYVNPDRRLPAYITKLTGIADADLIGAPRFSGVADQVLEFIGDDPILGHNVGFDIAFINAELDRCRKPTLANLPVDTMLLSVKVLHKVRRPSLDKVATELGLRPRRLHRALGDAELAAEAGLRLFVRAQEAGIDSLEQLLAVVTPRSSRRGGAAVAKPVLDRRHLAALPRTPGVYLMRDAMDAVIYVGKAKNIRERVSSYYSQPMGLTRKMDGLVEAIERIETVETGSELAALLLESELIRRFQPRYNAQLRHSEEYPYIRVDIGNPWPRVTLVRRRRSDGSLYFGPFRNRNAAKQTVELLGRAYRLRSCPRSFKDKRSYGSPCLELDLNRCMGPCMGKADPDTYRADVHEIVRYLSGDEEVLQERLRREIEGAAERLDYESARKIRHDIQTLDTIANQQRMITAAERDRCMLLVLPAASSGRGRCWSSRRAAVGAAPRRDDSTHDDVADRLATVWERFATTPAAPIDHQGIDEMSIISRWLYRPRELGRHRRDRRRDARLVGQRRGVLGSRARPCCAEPAEGDLTAARTL